MTGCGLVVHHVKGGECLFDNKHLMTGSEGNSPASGNKINCFPRDQSVICYIAGNSLHLAVTAVVGQHSRIPTFS